MRDNLDLQELRERATYYKSQSRRLRNRTLIIMLGIFIVMAWIYFQVKDPIGVLYIANGDLQIASTNAPVDMQFDRDGTLWIHTLYNDRMIEVTQLDWREYDAFEVYDGNVRVQHELNLIPFVGTLDEDNLPQSKIQDVGVNNQGRFIIDSSNTVYTDRAYEGWDTATKTLFTGVNSEPPSFISTDDVMYLHFDGLYKFDGNRWTGVMRLPDNSKFVGYTNGDIWIRTDTALLQYHTATDDVQSLDFGQAGIPTDKRINHVFADNAGAVYFATDDSIYHLENDVWQFIQTIDTLYGIQQAEFLPDGSLIVASTDLELAYSTNASNYHLVHLLFPALLPVIIVGVIFYVLSNSNRKTNAVRTERSRKLISALIADFEVDESKVAEAKKPPTAFILRLVGGFVCALFVPVLLNGTDIPPQISSLLGPIIFLGILFLPYLRRVVDFRDKTEETQRWRRWGLHFIISVVVFMIITPLLVTLVSFILPDFNQPILLVLVIYGGLWFAFFMYRRRKPSRILPRALATADYDKAIRDVQRFNVMAIQLINIGAVHMYAGQYQEAMNTYLQALRELQASNIIYISAALTGLAHALDRLGQFEEALRIHEAAISIYPEGTIPYLALVNSYNNNGVYPDRALELSYEMLQRFQSTRIHSIVSTEGKGIYKLAHALALANVGNFDGVDSLVEEARAEFDWDFLPGRAIFYHMHARILLAMNKIDQARALFQQAIEMDPDGDGGQLASNFLARL